MKGTSKKAPTRKHNERRRPKPTTAQVLRQIGIIVLVTAIWAGLLAGYLSLTGRSNEPAVASPTATEVAVVPATASPALTDTALSTEEPATSEPPTTASDTPAPEPTATEPPLTPTHTTEPPAGGISFSAEVLPVLTTRCERCHGEQRAEAGLKLTSYADLMAGSAKGPVVVPGSATTSTLVELIVSGEMPRRSPRLPESEIQTISTWVDEGALDN
jgi:cytoskeletal protein RodZ